MRATDVNSRSLHTPIKYRRIAPTAAHWSASCKHSPHTPRKFWVGPASWPQFRPLTLRIASQWPCATINARCCSVYQLRRVWGISKWHWDCEWRRFYGWTKAFYVSRGQVLWFLSFFKATQKAQILASMGSRRLWWGVAVGYGQSRPCYSAR